LSSDVNLRDYVRDVPDYPKPGILFRDITPLLADPEAFRKAVSAMADPIRDVRPSKVLAIEARGFMFGGAIARDLSIGFVPVRKPGKLPRRTARVDYELEYGMDGLEIHEDALDAGERVLIVDDVLATGGTAEAASRLAARVGARVVGVTVFIELDKLAGRARLPGLPVHAVLVL
jgi:adenine phosphoribosyltransferase